MSPQKTARTPRLTLRIEEPRWREDKTALALLRKSARLALAHGPADGRTLTILLTGDAQVRTLNAQFRGKRKATNVLSFPSEDRDYLGDIAMAHGVVEREAREQNKSFAAHAAHLAAHGVLHLLGHDHEDEREALAMETIETQILARLGYPDPYAAAGKAA